MALRLAPGVETPGCFRLVSPRREWSATFRSLQLTDELERWKISARADLRELKRRERRAPQRAGHDEGVRGISAKT